MRLTVMAVAFGMLAGCGTLGTGSQPPGPRPAAESKPPAPDFDSIMTEPDAVIRPLVSDTDSLLSYYQHVRKLASADLGKEHEAARQAYTRTRSEIDRVRFAMVLSLPGVPFGDEARALELLEPVAKNPNGRLNGLAQLLVSQLQERKRLDTNAQGLQQKLDALRSLERNLIERKR